MRERHAIPIKYFLTSSYEHLSEYQMIWGHFGAKITKTISTNAS